MLGALFVFAGMAEESAWAAGPGPVATDSSRDTAEESTSLIVMGDFNHDGLADTAQVSPPGNEPSEPGFLTISLGQSDGTLRQVPGRPAVGHRPRSIVAGDFNQDGIQDLIVGDGDGSLALFLGDGRGNMTSAGDIAHLSSVASIGTGDFNNDGILDVVVSDWRASSVIVLLGAGKGSFTRGWSFSLRARGTSPEISVADFNGDGRPDLAVVYGNEDSTTYDVMLGNGNGTFTHTSELSSVIDPNAHCPT
jgi:hypothetical protein